MGDKGEPANTTILLAQIAEGSDDAFNQLMDRLYGRLRALCAKMLKSYDHLRRWEQTDDVLQNAMLRLYRAVQEVRLESKRHLLNLAATQIRRTLIDLARHHFGPHGDGHNHHSDQGEVLALHTGPQQDFESLDWWTQFHESIESLPDDERETFELIWYAGMTQREAAEVLGVAERTVLRRLHRARMTLGQEIEPEPVDDAEESPSPTDE